MERLSLNVDNLSREKIREKVLQTWIKEDQGVGQYRYDVETCQDGSVIYLLRPANLNKGCDFVIVSENFLKFQNGKDKPPKHRDVIQLIESFCRGNSAMVEAMRTAFEEVYECVKPDEAIERTPTLKMTPQCAAERSLKLLKWMWIEQDVTYWTGQGRAMLWDGLAKWLNNLSGA
jgi:hypothetical protein